MPTVRPAAQRFDPLDPDFAADRFALLDALRDQASAVYLPALDAWAVTRYHDVRAVLADPAAFPSAGPSARGGHLAAEARAVYPMTGALHTYALIDLDRPRQTRLRQPLVRVFTPQRIRELEPLLAKDIEHLLERLFPGEGPADWSPDSPGSCPSARSAASSGCRSR